MKHTKNIDYKYFNEILSGNKTFELRLADWKCETGDEIELVEVDELHQPTGRKLTKKVGYVLKTRDLQFYPDDEVEEHGYQIISLLDEDKQ